MCVGGPGGAAGDVGGATGTPPGSNVGNFSGFGSPPGTVGVLPSIGQSIAPPVTGDVMGLGYGQQSAMSPDQASAISAESLTGIPFGANNMSFGNEGQVSGPPAGGPGISGAEKGGLTVAKGVATIASLLGLVASNFMGPLLAGAQMMTSEARGHGQPPGEVGPAMAAGANPAGLGGPGEAPPGPNFGSLTGITNPMLPGTQPTASEPRPVSMPVGNITSSLFSVPPPKMDLSSLMASRGVRGAGTKTASPEWFTKGKRGY